VRSLTELENDWTLEDAQIAHELLDELDRAEHVMHENARREAEANARRR
jgi:hypothetical protein